MPVILYLVNDKITKKKRKHIKQNGYFIFKNIFFKQLCFNEFREKRRKILENCPNRFLGFFFSSYNNYFKIIFFKLSFFLTGADL